MEGRPGTSRIELAGYHPPPPFREQWFGYITDIKIDLVIGVPREDFPTIPRTIRDVCPGVGRGLSGGNLFVRFSDTDSRNCPWSSLLLPGRNGLNRGRSRLLSRVEDILLSSPRAVPGEPRGIPDRSDSGRRDHRVSTDIQRATSRDLSVLIPIDSPATSRGNPDTR